MSRNLSANADLANKYAVGEILDMLGVPEFYDAGTSKWLAGGTWFTRTQVGDAIANQLTQTTSNAAMADNSQSAGECYTPMAVVGTVSVRAFSAGSSVLVYTNSGVQTVNTGISTDGYTHVVSDGTSFWAIAGNNSMIPSLTAGIAKSTDGITGVLQTITWPASRIPSVSSYYYIPETAAGMANRGVISKTSIFWAGSRFIALCGGDSSNFFALRSTDGITWTDDSTAVLDSSSTHFNAHDMRWNRSGNTVFISVGSVNRVSTDGGSTWSDISPRAVNSASQRWQKSLDNSILMTTFSTKYISTNGGLTWTDRTTALGFAGANLNSAAICKVSTVYTIVAVLNGVAKRIADGGATWSIINVPIGISGTISKIITDGTNLYLFTSAAQMLVSTDGGTTWILRLSTDITMAQVQKAIRLSSNTICLVYNQEALIWSTDNGVTWKTCYAAKNAISDFCTYSFVSSTTVPYLVLTEANSSKGYSISETELIAGSQHVRASATAPSAIRSGSSPRVRVA